MWGRSRKDVLAKPAIFEEEEEEEADESLYWMELLIAATRVSAQRLKSLMDELNEIVAMTVASQRTLRKA